MPDADLSGLRVLVVDDDPLMTELIAALLRAGGPGHAVVHAIDMATDGAAALARSAHVAPDLIICDLNMPDMDGVQLLQAIAERGACPNIILVSGEDPRVLEATCQFAQAKGLPVLGVIGKPIAAERLWELAAAYQPSPAASAPVRLGVALDRSRIVEGLRTGAMHLVYQPKVELASGALYGVECLLRWDDAQLGRIAPPDVVAAAEKAGLINQLTLAILDQVAIDYARMCRSGLRINCAVNVSMYNLYDGRMVERMKSALSSAGGRCEDFTFEVTEGHVVEDLAVVLEALIRLRLAGFKISIDDYGTGASSMQMLAQLPSSELKIDRSFVVGAHSAQGQLFLRSAVELGLGLNQTIVVEGVELEQEHRLAQELGCHLGQGFLYAHPMPIAELLDWARDRAIPAS